MPSKKLPPLVLIFISLILLGNVRLAFATELSETLMVDDAVAITLADNPGLAAMKARVESLAALSSQKGALPDPRLSLNMLNVPIDSFDFKQEAMTQMQIGLSQMLPFPGKLALRAAAAGHEANVARWEVDEMRLRLVRDVKTIWWNLYSTDRALEIVDRNVELMRQFVGVAQTKYKVGKGLQQDVLLAQLELSKLHDKEIGLRGLRRGQEARLNALLDQPTNRSLLLPQRVNETLPDIASEEHLLALASESRPVLAAHQSKIDAAHARLGLAKKDYSPDFNLGASYGYRGGKNLDGSDRADFLSIMLSMNLPIYAGARQDKAVDQRSSEVLFNQYQLNDTQGKVAAEVSQAIADYQRYREQAALLKQGIIPQAGQTVASMLAGYQVNKVDFLSLVRTQMTLFNYETRYWKSLSLANQARARLSSAVGKEQLPNENNGNRK